MAPIFDRSEVLASPYPPAGPVGTLVLEFAILGQIDLARDLHAILNREYPMNGLDENVKQLALAWNATGKWPEGSEKIEDEAELEALKAELEEDLWPEEIEDDDRTMDEAGLKRLLKLADEAEAAAEDEEDDEDADAQADLSLTSALVKALDISLKLAEDNAAKAPLDKLDDRSQGILKRIAERLHRGNQADALAGCARAWPYLTRGVLAEAAGTNKEKLEALGKDIRETTEQWFSKGPQPWSPSSKPLKELLQTCSDRSKEFWQDEYDEPAPDTLFTSSGASKEEVEELEKKLDAKLPEDFKEFLTTSNGFKQVIADGIFEDFEVPFFSTKEIAWRNHDEIVETGEDDDEDDKADGEEMQTEDGAKENGSSRAAKKIKLDDGAEASTKDIEDNSDDEEEIEGLEYLKGIMNTLNIELLPLPATAQYEIMEELDGEWPEIEKVVEIGASEDASLWLLPADQVKKVRDAYMKVFDSTEDESLKKAMHWAMVAFIGGEEDFRKLDTWVYVAWSNGHSHCWASFRRYLEELADTCTKLEKVEDEETTLREETLAYSCR